MSKTDERTAHEAFSVHRQLVINLFLATLAVVLITTVVLLLVNRTDGTSPITILQLVVLAGVLGAFVSALRRLYQVENVFPVSVFKGHLMGANLHRDLLADSAPGGRDRGGRPLHDLRGRNRHRAASAGIQLRAWSGPVQ